MYVCYLAHTRLRTPGLIHKCRKKNPQWNLGTTYRQSLVSNEIKQGTQVNSQYKPVKQTTINEYIYTVDTINTMQ